MNLFFVTLPLIMFAPFIIFFVLVIILIIKNYKKISKISDSITEKFSDDSLKKELLARIDERIQKVGNPEQNIFETNKIYYGLNHYVFYNAKDVISFNSKLSELNDLFIGKDSKSSAAMTEMRYALPFPGINNLNGITVTRTSDDLIVTKTIQGIIHIYLNEREIGIIDLQRKTITSNDKLIANVSYPDIYPMGIVEIKWNLAFGENKSADIIASQNLINTIKVIIPISKLAAAEIHGELNKEERAFVIAMILFVRIRNSLRP